MELDTAKRAAELHKERGELVAKRETIENKVKEFTIITLAGENGGEQKYSTELTYEKYPEIVEATRKQIVVMLTKAIDAVDAEIADL